MVDGTLQDEWGLEGALSVFAAPHAAHRLTPGRYVLQRMWAQEAPAVPPCIDTLRHRSAQMICRHRQHTK